MNPSSPDGLLLDPREIAFACSPHLNPAFSHAKAGTRDAHGLRLVDYIRAGEVEGTIEWLTELIQSSPKDIAKAMEAEPLRLSEVTKPSGGKRRIAIPTYRRRCIGNLVGSIIERSARMNLPDSVRAYLKGDHDGLQRTLLDAAQAVAEGTALHCAKLDIKDFFWTVPHSAVLEALRSYGSSERVVSIVEVLLTTPAVTYKHGKVHRIPVRKGIPAGLPEAPVLANLVPYSLDRTLTENRRIVYFRWCDDLFVGGPIRDEVVGAVNTVRAWARSHGVAIKGVDPRMNSRKLVEDVRQGRILFLGMEIDEHGYLHIPAEKAQEKLDKLRYMDERSVHGEVCGLSKYAGGRGLDLYDDEDLWNVVSGSERYWRPLDEPGTDRFLEAVGRTTNAPRACPDGPGAVWTVGLSPSDGREGGGIPPSRPRSAGLDRLHTDQKSTTDSPDQHLDPSSGIEELEGMVSESEIRVRDFSQEIREGQAGRDLGTLTGEELYQGDLIQGASSSYTGFGDGNDCDSLYSADFARSRSPFPLLQNSDPENPERSQDLEELDGAWGGSDPGEPPARSDAEDILVAHVGSRPPVNGVGLIGIQHGSGRPSVTEVCRGRPEVALVHRMAEVLLGQSGPVEFRMASTWLAKALVQRSRTIRSPYLLSAILRLHEVARRRQVVIVGGVEEPEALRSVLHRRRTVGTLARPNFLPFRGQLSV